MKTIFLCRGSLQDGLGHVTRSRTVAEQMKRHSQVRLVVIGDGCATPLLAGGQLDFVTVPDEPSALKTVDEFAPDVIFFDLLHFDPAAIRALATRATTVNLSPIFNAMAEVALMFHRTTRKGTDWPAGPEIRTGLNYAVVSSHTARIPEPVFEHHAGDPTLSIAISMGGTDAANKTQRVLEQLKECPSRLLIWLLLGEGYAHSYQELVNTIRGSHHEIILAKTNANMWRVLHLCSLALLAAGTTTYEAAYAGIPSINLLENPTNYFLIEELVEKGAALCAGHSFGESLRTLNNLIATLDVNRPRLHAMHRAAQSLVDGNGSARIADETVAFHKARSK